MSPRGSVGGACGSLPRCLVSHGRSVSAANSMPPEPVAAQAIRAQAAAQGRGRAPQLHSEMHPRAAGSPPTLPLPLPLPLTPTLALTLTLTLTLPPTLPLTLTLPLPCILERQALDPMAHHSLPDPMAHHRLTDSPPHRLTDSPPPGRGEHVTLTLTLTLSQALETMAHPFITRLYTTFQACTAPRPPRPLATRRSLLAPRLHPTCSLFSPPAASCMGHLAPAPRSE